MRCSNFCWISSNFLDDAFSKLVLLFFQVSFRLFPVFSHHDILMITKFFSGVSEDLFLPGIHEDLLIPDQTIVLLWEFAIFSSQLIFPFISTNFNCLSDDSDDWLIFALLYGFRHIIKEGLLQIQSLSKQMSSSKNQSCQR